MNVELISGISEPGEAAVDEIGQQIEVTPTENEESILEPSPFSDLVVFGDSLSDTGNVFQVSEGLFPPSPPYVDGRFSNGDLIVDIIAETFELPENESFLLDGSNYAFSGAQTGEGTSFTGFLEGLPELIEVPNIAQQIDLYLSDNTPTETDLFYIYGGGNDFIFPFAQGLALAEPELVVDNITAHITELAESGAKTFVVPNLPSLGIIPLFSEQPLEATAILNNVTDEFNQLLDLELDAIAAELEVTIIEPDYNGIVDGFIINPEQFGFTNTTDSVLDFNSGTLIGDPDEFLFWDIVHPTTAANDIIATKAIDLILSEITEPIPDANLEAKFGTVAADTIEVAGRDQLVFAGDLNDLVDASTGKGDNRIYAGNGDDTVILGSSDRVLAGVGDDAIFATSGGDNTITGDAGTDQFWIATAEIPESANIITDFTSGEDVIGIAGLGIGFADLSITALESNALISANGSDLAILQGIDATSLTDSDFAFA